MKKLVLKNATKKYGDVIAVQSANIEIDDQEFIVLVGPSGCGKTTTLRMIAGLESIDEGEIFINGRLINNLPPKDRDIAMVFQSYALYPHMNVYKNMAFGLKMRKASKSEIEVSVKDAANILGIQDLLGRKPRELSGGQRQRVALGRSIVRKPEVFLFDEPLSNLDAKLRANTRIELKKLHQRLQATIVYVTHDQVEAMTMGDRIVIMKGGVIQQIGTPLDLYNKPSNQFVAGFMGSPSMNFVQCSLFEKKSRLFIDAGDFTLPIIPSVASKLDLKRDKELVIGIRPEDFILIGSEVTISEDTPVLKLAVEVVETLGKEINLDASTGKHNFSVILNAGILIKPKQTIKLQPNVEKIHFFHKETGKTVI